jgi:hypothetical protein
MTKTFLSVALIAGTLMTCCTTGAFAWGCIAITESGAYGYSYSYSSRSGAVQRALEECSANGSGCKIVECDEEK